MAGSVTVQSGRVVTRSVAVGGIRRTAHWCNLTWSGHHVGSGPVAGREAMGGAARRGRGGRHEEAHGSVRGSRRPAAQGLRRGRLLARLRTAERLTVVVAPAGSGKTTLLAQHVEHAPGAVVWYRAGRQDGDAARLAEAVLWAAGRGRAPGARCPASWRRPWPRAARRSRSSSTTRTCCSTPRPRTTWSASSPRVRTACRCCSPPAGHPGSTSAGPSWARSPSSPPTTCGSGPGRSSRCSATTTGNRSRPTTSPR